MPSSRRYMIQLTHNNLQLEGAIIYSSKFYHIELTTPFYARNMGTSLMYMIPARYTTPLDLNRESDTHGIIRLEERAPQELIALYEFYKEHEFTHYVEHILGPHQTTLYSLLKENLLRIDQHKQKKKQIKEQFTRNEISNKEQSQRIQMENQHIQTCISSCSTIQAQYYKEHNIVIPDIHQQECKRLIERWHKEK